MNPCFQQAHEFTIKQQTNAVLRAVQHAQFAEFMAQGFPTRKDEAWRYIDLNKITNGQFQVAQNNSLTTLSDLQPYLMPDCDHLIFINGYFSQQLSTSFLANSGVAVSNINAAWSQASLLESQPSAFTCLNVALLTDGIMLTIAENQHLTRPIQILHYSTATEVAHMQHVRQLIILEKNTQAVIFENYIGCGDKEYFTNSVTQIELHPGASLDYAKKQQESLGSYHVATTQIKQHRDSILRATNLSSGSRVGRENLEIVQLGSNTVTELLGLYLLSQEQQVDQHIAVHHQAAHGSSQQLYKGILTDKAMAVFNGSIHVAKQAKTVNAQQTNKNLLLSKTASVNTKPALEIYADDVKCSHGATVGQIDDAALFYLQSRGLEKAEAMTLLMQAFIADVLENMPAVVQKNFCYSDTELQKFITSDLK